MSKYFRPWNIDQTLFLPPSVQDFVPKDHVSRFIVELVRESLDLKEITGSYVSGLGQPPFLPRPTTRWPIAATWRRILARTTSTSWGQSAIFSAPTISGNAILIIVRNFNDMPWLASQTDVTCPQCHAGFRRIEAETSPGLWGNTVVPFASICWSG
jgi:hypothetical protein